ncbi:MAG: 4Fe-4S binding protein [Burkholderiales bacterium]|nr:4Fe-4S binding protein [Burkholderiales bacterium]
METGTLLTLGDGLRLEEGACLPLRSHFGQCRACEKACPAHVLSVSIDGVALAPGCLGCGRCVSACPTDALELEGFELPAALPAGAGAVELECFKVPASANAEAIRVPCLGALSPGRLAELTERAGARGLVLVDRGWCGTCSAGCGATHPAKAALDVLALWLDAIGAPDRKPRLQSRPLPAAAMPEAIPHTRRDPNEQPLSRRDFFRRLAENPTGRPRDVSPMGASGRAAFPATGRHQSRERRRLVDALDAAAARAGTALPAELFPRVTNNGACADHRVCTAACPTGALKARADAQGARLEFAGEACIACGACTRACPEGALVLEAHGGARAPAVIATHAQRTCEACGDAFAPRGDEALCATCAKSQRFIRDAMSQLYRARS